MPTETDIVIQSVTNAGVGFAIILGDTPETVFIPPRQAGPRMLAPWQVYRAVIGPNPRKESGVPWLCHRLLGEPRPGQPYSGDTFIRKLMQTGLHDQVVVRALDCWHNGEFAQAVSYLGEALPVRYGDDG